MNQKVTQELLTLFQTKMSEAADVQYHAGLDQRRLETALANAAAAREEHFSDTQTLQKLHRARYPEWSYLGVICVA